MYDLLVQIVFEWAENGDLRRLLRRATGESRRREMNRTGMILSSAPFEEREVWKYFLQVASSIFL